MIISSQTWDLYMYLKLEYNCIKYTILTRIMYLYGNFINSNFIEIRISIIEQKMLIARETLVLEIRQ